jgi:hypothetical protein
MLLYKQHTIVAGASHSTSEHNYIPVAYIVWDILSVPSITDRDFHAFLSRERYATFEEATGAAYAEAKAWVDKHLDERLNFLSSPASLRRVKNSR